MSSVRHCGMNHENDLCLQRKFFSSVPGALILFHAPFHLNRYSVEKAQLQNEEGDFLK